MSGRQYCGEKENRGKQKMIVVLLWLECWEKAWAHTDTETWPLRTDAKLNLRDRGWDEVEKSFIEYRRLWNRFQAHISVASLSKRNNFHFLFII